MTRIVDTTIRSSLTFGDNLYLLGRSDDNAIEVYKLPLTYFDAPDEALIERSTLTLATSGNPWLAAKLAPYNADSLLVLAYSEHGNDENIHALLYNTGIRNMAIQDINTCWLSAASLDAFGLRRVSPGRFELFSDNDDKRYILDINDGFPAAGRRYTHAGAARRAGLHGISEL